MGPRLKSVFDGRALPEQMSALHQTTPARPVAGRLTTSVEQTVVEKKKHLEEAATGGGLPGEKPKTANMDKQLATVEETSSLRNTPPMDKKPSLSKSADAKEKAATVQDPAAAPHATEPPHATPSARPAPAVPDALDNRNGSQRPLLESRRAKSCQWTSDQGRCSLYAGQLQVHVLRRGVIRPGGPCPGTTRTTDPRAWL
jgi:hypothetical protein